MSNHERQYLIPLFFLKYVKYLIDKFAYLDHTNRGSVKKCVGNYLKR